MSDLSFLDQIPDPAQESPAAPPLELRGFGRRLPKGAPDRLETRRRRQAAFVLSGAWLLTHLAVFGVRHDHAELGWTYLAIQVGVPFLLALALLHVATRPGRFGLGTSTVIVAALAVLGPLSFWVIGAATPVPLFALPDAQPWLAALLCGDLMLAWMSAPLFAAALALRSAFAAAVVWRSALIGASVGLMSGATINLHCANPHPFHLLLGHGVPIVLASIVGALVVSRWVRA